jgi:hypothetical protein
MQGFKQPEGFKQPDLPATVQTASSMQGFKKPAPCRGSKSQLHTGVQTARSPCRGSNSQASVQGFKQPDRVQTASSMQGFKQPGLRAGVQTARPPCRGSNSQASVQGFKQPDLRAGVQTARLSFYVSTTTSSAYVCTEQTNMQQEMVAMLSKCLAT